MANDPSGPHWTEFYYSGINHLLWYPDWLSPRDSRGNYRSIAERMKRLRTLEAPLHHNIHLFLALAPASFVSRLLGVRSTVAAEFTMPDTLNIPPTIAGKVRNLAEICQPDVLLEADGVRIALEVKSGSKSSHEQVLKYAALMRQRGPCSEQKLIFVAPAKIFSELWTERYQDVTALREGVKAWQGDKVAEKLDGKLQSFGLTLAEAKDFLDSVEIIWLPTDDIRKIVCEELQSVVAQADVPATEVYRKLLAGFAEELGSWPKARYRGPEDPIETFVDSRRGQDLYSPAGRSWHEFHQWLASNKPPLPSEPPPPLDQASSEERQQRLLDQLEWARRRGGRLLEDALRRLRAIPLTEWQ